MTGVLDGELVLRSLTLLAAVGAGLSAGVFLAFSSFVMTGLGRAPDQVGMRAMQEINLAAPAPVFMITLFGTALLAVAIAVASAVMGGPGSILIMAGAAVYLVCVVVTIGYHVPRNEALAMIGPASAGSAGTWHRYLTEWTRMNHLRTLAATLGCVLLLLGSRA